jgi:hypothetical protein
VRETKLPVLGAGILVVATQARLDKRPSRHESATRYFWFFAVFDGWKRAGQAKGTQINQDGFTTNEFRQWAKL